jgi:hypothetical protein
MPRPNKHVYADVFEYLKKAPLKRLFDESLIEKLWAKDREWELHHYNRGKVVNSYVSSSWLKSLFGDRVLTRNLWADSFNRKIYLKCSSKYVAILHLSSKKETVS